MRINRAFYSIFLFVFLFSPLVLATKEKVKGPHENYKIDIKRSTISWKASGVLSKHNGTIGIKEGEAVFSDGLLVGGKIFIDMKQIQILSLKEVKKMNNLLEHLKSKDFFNLESSDKNKISKLTFTDVIFGKGGLYDITALMEIMGQSRVKLFKLEVVDLNNKEKKIKVNMSFDRTKFGIKYKSAKVFQDLGSYLIYDDVYLSIDLMITRSL